MLLFLVVQNDTLVFSVIFSHHIIVFSIGDIFFYYLFIFFNI